MTPETAEEIRKALARIIARLERKLKEQRGEPIFPVAGMIDHAKRLLDKAKQEEREEATRNL